MSAERGTTLEGMQDIAQKVALKIPDIAERRRETVRDLHSWEEVVSSTGRDARLSAAQNVLREFLHTTESQIDSERDRPMSPAKKYKPNEQTFRDFSGLNSEGWILTREEFEQKSGKYGEFNLERRQEAILLAEERRKQERARKKKKEYTAAIFVNRELKAIAARGNDVRVEEGIEWQTMLLLTAANTANRSRREGQYLSTANIKKYFAERGENVNVSDVISNILLAVGSGKSDLIERIERGKDTKYRLNGEVKYFNGPDTSFSEEIMPVDEIGRPKVIPIGSYRDKVMQLERDFPDTKQVVQELLGLIKEKHIVGPVNAEHLNGYFGTLTKTFVWGLREKRHIRPVSTLSGNYHPAYEIPDIVLMLYTRKRKGILSSHQYRDLRRLIKGEMEKAFARESQGNQG